MADTITVTELGKPSGISDGWPQPYEIAVTPVQGRLIPELPFLHKEDGIVTEDGTGYWITQAKQVPIKTTGGTVWSWVYRATRDASDDGESW